MKYLNAIVLLSFLFIKCNFKDDNCYTETTLNADNLKIKNKFKIEYTQSFIDNILKICKNKGLKQIDSIQIGFVILPLGLDSNLISVYEKECVKNNNTNVRQRELSLRIKDWNNFNGKISDQFEDIKVMTFDFWRFKIGDKTINIDQNENIDYNEIKEILNIIHSNNYITECDIEDLNPQKDIEHISYVVKDNDKYRIGFRFFGRYPSIVCLKKNNKLIIKEISVVVV